MVADVRIRAARPDEAELLRAIAAAAKGHWGYDPRLVSEWAATVDTGVDADSPKRAFVAEVSGEVAGWASLVQSRSVCVLEDLWLDPRWIGRGLGRALFEHAAHEARRLGAERMEWEAEPNALGFYERMGARRIRDSKPTEWGRVLPVLAVELREPWRRAAHDP